MTKSYQRITAQPTLATVGAVWKREFLEATNCHALGTITHFDLVEQKASASINYKKVMNEKVIEYPVLADCPVFIARGGGGYISFPIQVGDPCMICFNDVDMTQYLVSGKLIDAPPATTRRHAFTDGIILVGVNPFTKAISGYDGTNVTLRSPAKVSLENPTKNLRTEIEKLTTLLDTFFTATASAAVEPTLAPAATAAKTALALFKTSLQGLLK